MVKKIILVDNNRSGITSNRRSGFLEAVRQHFNTMDGLIIRRYNQISEEDLSSADGVILSSSRATIFTDFGVESNFVKKCTQPVLGICFGHQLIANAFGCQIITSPHPEKFRTPKPIDVEAGFPLLPLGGRIMVELNHQREVAPTGAFGTLFDNYAKSELCPIQAIKLKDKSIFGVQFHPETLHPSAISPGREILSNFLSCYRFGGNSLISAF